MENSFPICTMFSNESSSMRARFHLAGHAMLSTCPTLPRSENRVLGMLRSSA
jgi:hypothetical protein